MYRHIVLPAALIAATSAAIANPVFTPAVSLTGEPIPYVRISRTPSSVMAFDSTGRLHLVYWVGAEQTTVNSPSAILYRNWSVADGWSAPEAVDNSFQGPNPVGGRQPSLAITPDDTVHIAWHDHRHGTLALNYNDNTEIYLDSRPANGAFSSTDIRLTSTTAGGPGDNGFTPRIFATSDGRLHLAWYDFTANSGVSDIYFMRSDSSGVFDTAAPIANHRLTDETTRGGTPAYTVPDLVVDATGAAHIVWIGGTGSVLSPIFHGKVTTGPDFESTNSLTGNSGFLDPPRTVLAPNGDVWVVYTDTTTPSNPDIRAIRLPGGDASAAGVYTLRNTAARETTPAAAIDSSGLLHLAWVQGSTATRTVHYGVFDPVASTFGDVVEVLDAEGSYERVAMVLDAGERPVLVVQEQTDATNARLLFTRLAEQMNTGALWSVYE